MHVYTDISFGWKDYLFDLHIAADRFEDVKRRHSGEDDERIAINAAAEALNLVLNNRRGSPEISYRTLEQVLAERGVPRVAILDAHGISVNGVWHYGETRDGIRTDWEYEASPIEVRDGSGLVTVTQLVRLPEGFIFPAKGGKIEEVHAVDSWIARQSGRRNGALVLHCCNEDACKPKRVDTPVFYAEGNIGLSSFYRTRMLEPEDVAAPGEK